MEKAGRLGKTLSYIGAENIISPLGQTAEDNFARASHGQSAIKVPFKNHDFAKVPVAQIETLDVLTDHTKVESLAISSALAALHSLDLTHASSRWLLILSTTKGDIDQLSAGNLEKARLTYLAHRIEKALPISMETMVVSNACISGVSAVILAHDMLNASQFDQVLVVGVDLVSAFTYTGFESFFAMSDEICRPFDVSRKGLNLGEAAAAVVVSNQRSIFTTKPFQIKGGATANDANHISGPSRAGEGLYRAVQKCLSLTGESVENIDFISAHGTATQYNDDMESVAFTRLKLVNTPINSFKGYFGHTLGAAGLLEIGMSLQSMRHDLLLKSMGCDNVGTTDTLHVLKENLGKPVHTVLKTASGFGGCNAACLIKKVDE